MAAKFWRLGDRSGDFVVARRREGDSLAAFFAISPPNILLVVSQGRVILVDQECAASYPEIFGPFVNQAATIAGKHVAIDTVPMIAEFRNAAPAFDVADMVRRFMGDR
jgi:hypothetical protein